MVYIETIPENIPIGFSIQTEDDLVHTSAILERDTYWVTAHIVRTLRGGRGVRATGVLDFNRLSAATDHCVFQYDYVHTAVTVVRVQPNRITRNIHSAYRHHA